MDFKPGKGRKVAFWRTLAEAEGLPPPKTARDYGKLYRRWELYGYADSDLAKKYVEELKRRGYRLVNKDIKHCVCGAPIKNRWIIVNHTARLYAYVGSECKEKFFLPAPLTPRMALKQAVMILGNQIAQTERFGLDVSILETLLGKALIYIEKFTTYDEVYVSEWFVKKLELYTGIRWKWKTWEDIQGRTETSRRTKKEETTSRQT